MTESKLERYVKEYMRGNTDCFDYVYKETERCVFLSAYSILSDKDEARDVMQDTYIKAINSLSSYKMGTNFKAWISSIARNLAIDRYRKLKKTVHTEEILFDTSTSDQNNGRGLIEKAYTILSQDERMRAVFTYRAVFSLGFREIGEILDIPKSTVSDIFKKASLKIREGIKDEL